MSITLDKAYTIISAAFEKGGELGLKPLSVAVLDAGGHVIAFARQDGSSNLRFKIAEGKAAGAIALGMGSRAIFERAQQQPYFVGALNGLILPFGFGILIWVALRRKDLLGGYDYPKWLAYIGLAIFVLTIYLGYQSFSGIVDLWQ